MTRVAIRRALISVYDKTGLADLARGLHAAGVEIVSTGSTAAAVSASGVPVTRVEDVTGFPECLDGRVKTLHPAVHAGLLADLSRPAHRAQLSDLGIAPFELLVSNLYPFEAAVAGGAAPEECVEQIDIGGPAMVRAAAKNHSHVAVITDPADVWGGPGGGGRRWVHAGTAAQVRGAGLRAHRRLRLRRGLLVRVRLRARRDRAGNRLAGCQRRRVDQARCAPLRGEPAPAGRPLPAERCGRAAGRRCAALAAGRRCGITAGTQLHGKAMSYNNYVDAAAAWRAAFDFTEPCVAIIKHSNPCGIAVGADLAEAHRKAHACDPVSAFGGVIAANRLVTADLARQIADIFTEVVIAPGFEPDALDVLTAKKNLRLLACPPPVTAGLGSGRPPVRSSEAARAARTAASGRVARVAQAPNGARSTAECWSRRRT